jgi:prepilin-type N-terminal cleavage/methylation domain-containing protein
MNHTRSHKGKGFTLLELLIVIAILAVLGAVVVFVLNPAETLRKTRDSQRISDLSTIKTALGVYITSTTTPMLAGASYTLRNETCLNGSGTKTLYYSYPSDSPGATITDTSFDGGAFTAVGQVTNANIGKVDGTGWIPVNLQVLTSGVPVSNWPVDPTNTVTTLSATASTTDYVYRYACDKNDLSFEIDAKLESTTYTSGSENKLLTDGGNASLLYETGTKLTVLGAGDF